MAKIHDLLERVGDANLRSALRDEFERATKHKKFGLVFEEHLPECTPLWGMKIRRGMMVARKDGDFNDVLMVQRIKDNIATCWHASANATEDIAIDDLIPIARFGDPIYPVLTPIDAVENAPGDKLWHTLIQADNYHALQLYGRDEGERRLDADGPGLWRNVYACRRRRASAPHLDLGAEARIHHPRTLRTSFLRIDSLPFPSDSLHCTNFPCE